LNGKDSLQNIEVDSEWTKQFSIQPQQVQEDSNQDMSITQVKEQPLDQSDLSKKIAELETSRSLVLKSIPKVSELPQKVQADLNSLAGNIPQEIPRAPIEVSTELEVERGITTSNQRVVRKEHYLNIAVEPATGGSASGSVITMGGPGANLDRNYQNVESVELLQFSAAVAALTVDSPNILVLYINELYSNENTKWVTVNSNINFKNAFAVIPYTFIDEDNKTEVKWDHQGGGKSRFISYFNPLRTLDKLTCDLLYNTSGASTAQALTSGEEMYMLLRITTVEKESLPSVFER
jgi:hypothetical protein